MPLYAPVSTQLNRPKDRLKTVVIGNSIAVLGQYAAGAVQTSSEVFWANAFAGDVIEYPEIDSTARSDVYGTYGYGGQLLGTINTDMVTTFFPVLDTANIVPDLVWGVALLENDIGQDRSYAQIVADLTTFIGIVKAKWPGAIIMLSTVRPTFSNSVASRLLTWQQINAYILSLDNGYDIFCYSQDANQDTQNPGQPRKIVVNGTCVSTTMTVNSIVSGTTPIGIGNYVTDNAHRVLSLESATTGDVGTYVISPALTADINPAADFTIYAESDNSVHPTPLTAVKQGKIAAACLNRITASAKRPNNIVSTNFNLSGSGAASGTGVSGTIPTGTSMANLAAPITCVCLALNPGVRLTYANFASANVKTAVADYTMSDFTMTQPIDAFKLFAKLKIVSGAQYLRHIRSRPRVTDNTVLAATSEFFASASTNTRSGFINGDTLTISSPIIRSAGAGVLIGAIRNMLAFEFVERFPAGASVVIEVYEQGFELPYKNKGIATLAAGTVTVTCADVKAGTKIKIGLKTPGGTPGALFISAKTAGTSFVITSTNAADTSVITWELDNT